MVRSAKHNLHRLFHSSRFLDKSALRTLYVAHVRSRMEYLSPIWMGASQSDLNKLDRINARACKLIGSKVSGSLQTLHHRRGVASFCMMYRMTHNIAPAPLQALCPQFSAPPLPPVRFTRRSAALASIPYKPLLTSLISLRSSQTWKKCLLPRLIDGWNTLSISQQSSSSLFSFKKKINDSIYMHNIWPYTAVEDPLSAIATCM